MAQTLRNLIMNIGDKVVCTDAGANPDFPEYQSPLRANTVYVVLSVGIAPDGQTGISIIGLDAPKEFYGNLFNIRRFRLLSEMKNEAAKQKAAYENSPIYRLLYGTKIYPKLTGD